MVKFALFLSCKVKNIDNWALNRWISKVETNLDKPFMSVCLCHFSYSSLKKFTSQLEHSLRLTHQSEDNIRSAVSTEIRCSI